MKTKVLIIVRGPHGLCSFHLLPTWFPHLLSPLPPILTPFQPHWPPWWFSMSEVLPPFGLRVWGPRFWAFYLTDFLNFLRSLLKCHLWLKPVLTILFLIVTHLMGAPNPSYFTVFFPIALYLLVIYNLLTYCIYYNCRSTTNLPQEYKLYKHSLKKYFVHCYIPSTYVSTCCWVGS